MGLYLLLLEYFGCSKLTPGPYPALRTFSDLPKEIASVTCVGNVMMCCRLCSHI